jgi:hypothetical protein
MLSDGLTAIRWLLASGEPGTPAQRFRLIEKHVTTFRKAPATGLLFFLLSLMHTLSFVNCKANVTVIFLTKQAKTN